MTRLREWRPAEDELKSSKEFTVKWPGSVPLFQEYGVIATAGTYVLDRSTGPKWIQALADILDEVVRIMDEQSRSGEALLSDEAVKKVANYTRLVYLFLQVDELCGLFKLELFINITPVGCLQHTDDDDPIPFPDDMRVSEGKDSLFRFLRTLTMWHQAVGSLFSFPDRLKLLSSLRACLVSVTACHGGSSDFDAVLQKFKDDPKECQDVKTWMENQLTKCGGTSAARVHAEATLMLLAYRGPGKGVDTCAENKIPSLTLKVRFSRLPRHSIV